MDGIGRLGHDSPHGPNADWRVLTTADAAGTNGLTCLPKHGGTRDRRFLVTHPMTDHCETGHCLSGCEMWADRIDAFGGNEDYTSKLAVYRKVMRIRVHSEYDERTVSNDIGLALVNRNFDLNNNVKRLIVPVQFPNYKTGTVAGWGVTNNWSGGTRVLKSVAQNIRTPDICRAIYGFKSGMLCAGSKEKNVDQPASGDSGSALVSSNYQQVGMGLVSYKDMRWPALIVYSNLTYYHRWITTYSKALYCNY
ncbi:hypothetical protein evm_011836 [Chilo suppressalis]|nr:hypothetical protein evm_011836 [Chilo suppressalis]